MKIRKSGSQEKCLAINLQGTTRTVKHLASGEVRLYVYMGRGGEQLCHATGKDVPDATQKAQELLRTKEVLSRYAELLKPKRQSQNQRQISLAVAAFYESAEFEGLRPSSRKEYRYYLEKFRSDFGEYPLRIFEKPQLKEDIYDWREQWRSKNRSADYAISSVSRFFGWARSRGWTSARPTDDIERLYKSNRADKIWSDEQLNRLCECASKPVADVVMVAAYTGYRLIDLLRLPWTAIGEKVVSIKSSKRGRTEVKPIIKALRTRLEGIPKASPIVLLSTRGTPWTADGFRSSFDAAMDRAKIDGLMFRDLRGTAITKMYLAGQTDPHRLARMFGWSLASVKELLNVYVSPDALNEDMAEWVEQNASLDTAVGIKQKRPLTNRCQTGL